jgi:hypothetical protein
MSEWSRLITESTKSATFEAKLKMPPIIFSHPMIKPPVSRLQQQQHLSKHWPFISGNLIFMTRIKTQVLIGARAIVKCKDN